MTANYSFQFNFLHPRHWLMWLAFGVMWLVSQLPLPLLRVLGAGIGWAFRKLSKRRAHIVRVNLKLCFPEKTDVEREVILKQCFANIGLGLFESAIGWWASDKRIQKLYGVEGVEHLQAALDQGHSILMLSYHVTSLELAGRVFSQLAPTTAMFQTYHNPVFNYVVWRARNKHMQGVVERKDLRGMLRALKQPQIVCYLPDQDVGLFRHVFVPFFHKLATSITATAWLSEKTGAKLMPAQFFRVGSTYQVVFSALEEAFPSGDEVKDAAHVNHLMAERIAQHPAQYLWTHRRFKRTPEGCEYPY